VPTGWQGRSFEISTPRGFPLSASCWTPAGRWPYIQVVVERHTTAPGSLPGLRTGPQKPTATTVGQGRLPNDESPRFSIAKTIRSGLEPFTGPLRRSWRHFHLTPPKRIAASGPGTEFHGKEGWPGALGKNSGEIFPAPNSAQIGRLGTG